MPKTKIQVHIDQNVSEHVTRLAGKLGANEPEILRRLINLGLDDALLLEKSGMLAVVLKAGEIMNKLKQQFLFKGKTEISLEDLK